MNTDFVCAIWFILLQFLQAADIERMLPKGAKDTASQRSDDITLVSMGGISASVQHVKIQSAEMQREIAQQATDIQGIKQQTAEILQVLTLPNVTR